MARSESSARPVSANADTRVPLRFCCCAVVYVLGRMTSGASVLQGCIHALRAHAFRIIVFGRESERWFQRSLFVYRLNQPSSKSK